MLHSVKSPVLLLLLSCSVSEASNVWNALRHEHLNGIIRAEEGTDDRGPQDENELALRERQRCRHPHEERALY